MALKILVIIIICIFLIVILREVSYGFSEWVKDIWEEGGGKKL